MRVAGKVEVFYVLSKVIYPLIAPSNLCLILVGTGFALRLGARYRRWGSRLVAVGFGLLLFTGFSPLGKWLTIPLEARFAESRLPDGANVTHIMFLGGFEDALVGRERGQLAANAAGERLLGALELADRFPTAKLVFAGGYGWLFGERVNGTSMIVDYMAAVGIARERIITEGQSRNTSENAAFIARELGRASGGCPCGFVLVTSAFHMPRAMGVFRKAGFEGDDQRLYPYPVDYRTRGAVDAWAPYDALHEGLEQTDIAFKEWVGLLAYRLSGRTDTLWPGPRPASRAPGARGDDLQKGRPGASIRSITWP
jgi:uncharacterized SAM-binding protein YcdF (DUF218 family)